MSKTIAKFKVLCAYETEVTVYQDDGIPTAEATVEIPFGTCQISLQSSNNPALMLDGKRVEELGRVGLSAMLRAITDGVSAQTGRGQPIAPVVPLHAVETPPIEEVAKLASPSEPKPSA